jgi:hypothetical protein
MGRRRNWLLCLLLALAMIYGAILILWPGARPSIMGMRRPAAVETPPNAAWGRVSPVSIARSAVDEQTLFDQVAVTIKIPAADDVPSGGQDGGCPRHRICDILGITLGEPHGLEVAGVLPQGPAGRAGIEPGDRMGKPTDCPSTVLPHFLPDTDARAVEWTIRRPR